MQNNVEEVGPFQFFILMLSIYVLCALFFQSAFNLSSEVNDVLNLADNVICLFFLADFFIRFSQAHNKRKFMKWGWVDLVSSIPMIDALRFGRTIRVFKVLRILRAARSVRVILGHTLHHKSRGAFAVAASTSILLVIFGSIAMLQLERDVPGANIETASDAVWWSFVTLTTVGYGDYYPVTLEGRIIAAILMTVGVGLFGIFTGLVASWLLEENGDKKDQHNVMTLQREVVELGKKLDKLNWQLEQANKGSPRGNTPDV